MKIVQPSYEILTDISEGGIQELQSIEHAARTCYKSEDKISGDGESAKKLIKRLIESGHEAMLEHSSLSVKFICDRGVSHEIVRHRMASFAQESTRYCNYSKGKFGGEITVIEPVIFENIESTINEDELPFLYKALYLAQPKWAYDKLKAMDVLTKTYVLWMAHCQAANEVYNAMLEDGMTPEIARSVLPNSLKTEIVVTANYREWRHIFDLRCDAAAHHEMRRLMRPLLEELHKRIPVIFDDLYDHYFGTYKL